MLKRSLIMQDIREVPRTKKKTPRKNKRKRKLKTFKILFKVLEGFLLVLKIIGVVLEFLKK